MKTNWKKSIVLTILLSFVLMPNAWAFQYEHERNKLEYTTIDNDHVSVSNNAGNQLTNNLVIPSQVEYNGKTYTVTHVGISGFYEEPNIVSLTLPNTIKEIGYKAFAHCTNLSDLTISSDIITLNNQAFYGCTNLKNITFNGDIETLGDQTFFGCSSLTSVNFNGTVNTIGNQAFYQCNNLTSINFNQNTPPTLNLRKITNEANFSKIIFTIPNNTINDYVQAWSSLLPRIYEKSNNIFYVGGLIYTKTNNTEVSVRWGCGSGALNIGNSIAHKDGNSYNITSVETKGFYKKSYTSIQLGKNIKRIEQQAFARITGMYGKTIIFPSTLTYIGNDAFIGCASTYEFTSDILPSLGEEVYDIFPHVDDDSNENYGITFIIPSCKVFLSIAANWNYPFFTNYVYAKDKCSYNITKDNENNFADIPTNKSQEEFGKITYTRFFKPGVWETLYLPFELGSMLIGLDGVDYKDKAWKSDKDPGNFYLAKLDNGTTDFIVTDELKGHTPYIIQFPDHPYYENNPITFVSKNNYNIISSGWSQQTNQLTMYGNTTLQQQSITNSYYLNVESNDNNFKLATTKLNPFECYISPEQNPSSRLAIRIRPQDGVTTGIPTIDTNQLFWYRNGNSLIIQTKGQPVKIYNINGALIQSFAEGQEQITVELTSGYYIINSAGTAQKIIF